MMHDFKSLQRKKELVNFHFYFQYLISSRADCDQRAKDVTCKYPEECTTITQHFSQCLLVVPSSDRDLMNANLLQAH